MVNRLVSHTRHQGDANMWQVASCTTSITQPMKAEATASETKMIHQDRTPMIPWLDGHGHLTVNDDSAYIPTWEAWLHHECRMYRGSLLSNGTIRASRTKYIEPSTTGHRTYSFK
eukprot:2575555-Amphidinium_carterae.2